MNLVLGLVVADGVLGLTMPIVDVSSTAFHTCMIIEAATLVMRWNDFVYGDTYFRQMIGTAMSTPAAIL